MIENVFENQFQNKVKVEIGDQINTTLETNMVKFEQNLTQKLLSELNMHVDEQVQILLDQRALIIESNISKTIISRAEFQESINKAIKAYCSDHDGEQVEILREELTLFKNEYKESKNKMK